ncbi:formylglycine-generating enzyme family protein [Lusitaniella coriacea LEGE 07157]|uniref:Formylglycine-generating enzyme family protein n=2 Tax=Lusitaniella TaxID=1983104 RepID=A0A8J7E0A0_9CYAN|nr:formylglycine-generating enzyme family protein [Lusitaniella coriacea LEGE 07157]
MLPSKFWRRTALRKAESVWMSSRTPGANNLHWQVESQTPWEEDGGSPAGFPVPVVTFNPYALGVWAQTVAGLGGTQIAGYSFTKTSSRLALLPSIPSFEDFIATTSPTARRLAALMAAVPVQLPIARLIQQTMLPQSDTTHLAEVFLSGILRRENDCDDPERRLYRFVGEMRKNLLDSIPRSEALRAIDRISAYVARRAGLSIQDFRALLMFPSERGKGEFGLEIDAFGRVAVEVLKYLGGELAAFAEELEGNVVAAAMAAHGEVSSPEPTLKTFSFDVATLVVVETQVFTFDVATLERRRGVKGSAGGWVIQRQKQEATGIIEVLEGDVPLELMEIPGGTFMMGSSEDEPRRFESESPQHEVRVPPFYLGRFPVTQAQWRVVAGWEKVERELDPDPSHFKEPYEEYDRLSRPVEQVSWYDAVEFCARLSRETGWEYRLPSEAEWEYACRSVISHQSSVISESSENPAYPPFHFGEMISTEVANYHGNYTYGEGEKGEYREQTTPVGYFQVANGFGLYDMHGNVWEWCADPWHENYEGAPNDGSVWQSSYKNTTKVRRGGSWFNGPGYCRSAYRDYYYPDSRSYNFGFRVARSAPRTP